MNKEKLKLLKNKLLLISLMSMLGSNVIACGKEEVKNIDISKIIIPIDDFSDQTTFSTTNLNSNLTTTNSVQQIEEVTPKKIADTMDDVMDLINLGNIKKVYYATDEVELTIPSFLSDSGEDEIVTLPKLECLEVYDQLDDTCLVKTNEYIGYVNTTNNLEELTGTFVVVDISSQELKLYQDNKIILYSPVITGKPGKNESDKGLFEIYNITTSRELVGPTYKSYVDIMMKYNGGEGLHDAQYHTHEDGFKHGWRSLEDFGGETYLTDGSHGCVNMIHDDVMTVREYVDLGTKVLVKE